MTNSIKPSNMIIKNLCGYYITICSQCSDLVDPDDKKCPKCGHDFFKKNDAPSEATKKVIQEYEYKPDNTIQ